MKTEYIEQHRGLSIYKKVINKSLSDDSFKKELLNNPRLVLENFVEDKLKLPAEIKIIVEDQSDLSTIYLNIPRKMDINDFELTDDQLEQVAGGDIIVGSLVVGGAMVAGYLVGKYLL